MFNKKMHIWISSYLDNELSDKERVFVENKIKIDPEWEKIYIAFKKNKEVIISLKAIPENNQLFNSVLNKIRSKDNQKESFIPIPKKYIPAAALLVASALVFVILFVFQHKGGIESFVKQNTYMVQNIYENTLGNNDLYPVNASLTNDDVFKFAVYGTIPAENKSGKYIQIGNNEKTGYFVEVSDENKLKKAQQQVRLQEVYEELNVDKTQQKRIDDVLQSFKKSIEVSVLAAPKNYLAVDPNMWNVQNAVVYEISKNLSSKQRRDFYNMTGIPYVKHANLNYSDSKKDSIARAYVSISHSPREFLVFKPDTLIVRKIKINYDSMQLKVQKLKEKHLNFDFEFHNLARKKIGNSSYAISVGKESKNTGRMKVIVHDDLVKGTNVSVIFDTATIRIDIPDMSDLLPDKNCFNVFEFKDLKNLPKINEEIKKNHKLQRKLEKDLREAEKIFRNQFTNPEQKKIFLRKKDSIIHMLKSDSSKKLPKYFDALNDKNMMEFEKLPKLFKKNEGFINSFINNFLDEKNSKLLDSIFQNVNLDSILNETFHQIQGQIKPVE